MLLRVFLASLLLMSGSVGAEPRTDDPLEFINRPLFLVNDVLDRSVLKPVAKGYDYALPQPAKAGVSNFFSNLLDVNSILNALLQGRLDRAGLNAGRVAVNSSIGMFGLFDVASRLGMARERSDFGQTLGVWGVPEGPYLMLPLLGPRTVRSGAGAIVDTVASVTAQMVDDNPTRNLAFFMELVSARAQLLEADQLISGDRYIFVRDAYLQQRRAMLSDGEVHDDFSDYEDSWAEEF